MSLRRNQVLMTIAIAIAIAITMLVYRGNTITATVVWDCDNTNTIAMLAKEGCSVAAAFEELPVRNSKVIQAYVDGLVSPPH